MAFKLAELKTAPLPSTEELRQAEKAVQQAMNNWQALLARSRDRTRLIREQESRMKVREQAVEDKMEMQKIRRVQKFAGTRGMVRVAKALGVSQT